jgi:hypothetical protein
MAQVKAMPRKSALINCINGCIFMRQVSGLFQSKDPVASVTAFLRWAPGWVGGPEIREIVIF